jgi:hypothetical protein
MIHLISHEAKGQGRIAMPVLVITILMANGVFVLHPKSLTDYVQMLNYVTTIAGQKSLAEALPTIIEAHHYVWVYGFPIVIALDLYRMRRPSSPQEQGGHVALYVGRE